MLFVFTWPRHSNAEIFVLLTKPEQRVLLTFRQYLITPGQILCFYGPNLKKHQPALRELTRKEMLVKERFEGAYSLTNSGYHAMRSVAVAK